jgi:hypothetical protein
MNEAAYRKIIFKVTGKEPVTYTKTRQGPVNIDENVGVGSCFDPTPFEPEPTPRETPAPYFLAEILSLHRLSQEECRHVHAAKLAYGDVRLLQDGKFS